MTKLAQRPPGNPMTMLSPDVCDEVIANTVKSRDDLTLEEIDLDRPRIESLWDVAKPVDTPLFPAIEEELPPVLLTTNHDIREVRHKTVAFDGPLFYMSTVEDVVILSYVPVVASHLYLAGQTANMQVWRKAYGDTGFDNDHAAAALESLTYELPCGVVVLTPAMCRSLSGCLDFNLTFAQDPALALYEAGFDLSNPFEGQMLVSPKDLFVLDVMKEKPRYISTYVMHLLALWKSPARPATKQRVIMLLSINDVPTEDQVQRVRQMSEDEGLDVAEVFVLSRYGGNASPSPDELVERLEHALGDADDTTTLLAVHQGVAFDLAQFVITTALKTFLDRHPSIRLGLDTRRSAGPGESFGIWFDQPSDLEVVFTTLDGE